MKYVKMLALAAVAAGALMAFLGAGTASATVLCSTTADPCPKAQDVAVGTVFDASIPSGSKAVLTDTSGEPIDTCTTSTAKGKVSSTGSSTSTVSGPVEELTWGSCTFPTVTLTKGSLELHKVSGTSNGTVTAGGTFEVTVNTIFFGSCIFEVEKGADLGKLIEGKPATFEANAVAVKATGGIACPSTALWSAKYTLTEPKETTVSVSESSA